MLREHGVDATVAVGDIVDGPGGDVDRCCRLLEQAEVMAVRGNHERWLLTGERRHERNATQRISEHTQAYLESLPTTRQLETASGRALLCHGVGEDDMAFLTPETQGYGLQAIGELRELMLRSDLDFAIGGHTHRRMVRCFPGLTFINVGSLHPQDEPCFAVLDFEAQQVQFYDLGSGLGVERSEPLALPRPAPIEGRG